MAGICIFAASSPNIDDKYIHFMNKILNNQDIYNI